MWITGDKKIPLHLRLKENTSLHYISNCALKVCMKNIKLFDKCHAMLLSHRQRDHNQIPSLHGFNICRTFLSEFRVRNQYLYQLMDHENSSDCTQQEVDQLIYCVVKDYIFISLKNAISGPKIAASTRPSSCPKMRLASVSNGFMDFIREKSSKGGVGISGF